MASTWFWSWFGLVWFVGVEVWERKEEEEWSGLVRLSAVCMLSAVRTAVHCDIESKCEMNAQRWDPYSSWVQQPSESRFVIPAASGHLCFYSTYYLYPVREKEVLQCERKGVLFRRYFAIAGGILVRFRFTSLLMFPGNSQICTILCARWWFYSCSVVFLIFVLFCFKKILHSVHFRHCMVRLLSEGMMFVSAELRRPGCSFHRCDDILPMRIIAYICTLQIITWELGQRSF